MLDKLKIAYKKCEEQVKYIIFGGLTTLVNWVAYTIMLVWFHQSIEVSNVIAWIFAVVFAYITNKRYVFKSKQSDTKAILKEFVLFIGSRLLTGGVEIIGFPVVYHLGLNHAIFGIDGFLAKIIISVIVIILNYVLSKIVVFKK